MKIEVELISQNLIKPSCPTPDHLRCHQLSSMDQVMTPVFMPWLLFYPESIHTNNKERYDQVKKSLAETLTIFYPVAGRFKENEYVSCNDEGIPFVEARANCKILDFLRDPDCSDINVLLPFALNGDTDLVAFVQVTYFECGGISIGLGMSHKIGDAFSSIMFLNTWSTITRGGSNTFVPRFDSARYFPPIKVSDFDPSFEIVKDKIATRKFVFDASRISALRDRYVDKSNIDHPIRPTRIEALTAFIWSRFYATTQAEGDRDKIFTVHHPVNLRPRMEPKLSEEHFGNIFVEPIVAIPDMDARDGCYGIISQMKNTIRNVNADYVKRLQSANGLLDSMKERAERTNKGEVVPLNFTSCCRFPIYDIDFGWGKPMRVASASWPYKNLVTFFDTPKGDGIETWIHLKEEDMAKFVPDDELAAFVSPIGM